MDINLRGAMDGTEAAEVLRNDFGIPAVFVTAYADESTLRRAKRAEPAGFVLKPFDRRELHATIEEALCSTNNRRSPASP